MRESLSGRLRPKMSSGAILAVSPEDVIFKAESTTSGKNISSFQRKAQNGPADDHRWDRFQVPRTLL
jgi:hypothetical protein